MNGDVLEDPMAGERLLASACRFLADGGEEELARILATCSARVRPAEEPLSFGGGTQTVLEIFITAPRQAYDVLTANEDDQGQYDEPIYRALRALTRNSMTARFHVLAELIEPEDDWREAYGGTKPRDPPLPPPRELPAGDDDVVF